MTWNNSFNSRKNKWRDALNTAQDIWIPYRAANFLYLGRISNISIKFGLTFMVPCIMI